MTAAGQRFSCLTAFRGIAATLIAVRHFEELGVRILPLSRSLFLTRSYLLVDLFFVMSGFIIAYVYVDRFGSHISWVTARKFVAARFARIYPLHFFVLLIMILAFLFQSPLEQNQVDVQNPYAIVSHILLIQSFGIHDGYTWNVPSWSISAEWWCYMLFPILAIGVNRTRTAFWALAVLSIALYLFLTFSIGKPNLDIGFDYGFVRGLAGFSAGMVLYRIYKKSVARHFFSSDFSLVFFALTFGFGLHYDVLDIAVIIPILGLVLSAVHSDGKAARFLDARPWQFLGKISYSIYMIHILVFFVFVNLLRSHIANFPSLPTADVSTLTALSACCVFLIATIALSWFTYSFVERPCRERLRNLGARH